MFRFTLTSATGTEVLTRDPQGWSEMEIRLRRDQKYHGVFKEYSQTLGFKCDGGGKEFIDDEWDANGLNGDVELLIEYQCGNEGFATLFPGRLNFKTYKRENSAGVDVTTINVEMDNIITKVRNRDEVEVDLEAATSMEGVSLGASYAFGNYDIDFHSKVIHLQSRLENGSAQSAIGTVNLGSPAVFEIAANVPLPVTSNQIKQTDTLATTFNTTVGHANLEAFRGSDSLPFHNTNSMPLPKVVPGTYEFTWDINGDYYDRPLLGSPVRQTIGSPSNVVTLDLWVGVDLATATRYNIGSIAGYSVGGAATHTAAFNFSGSVSITIADGDKIWVGWGSGYQVTSTAPGANQIEFEFAYDANSYLNFTLDSTTPATVGKGWAIFEAFSRVSGYIADKATAFDSEFFGRKNSSPTAYSSNGCGLFTAVTNGLSIRGFNNDSYNEPVTFTLETLFDSCDGIWDIGLGIENDMIKVENKSYFYDSSTTIFSATRIPTLSMSIDLTFVFNQVLIGFKKWENEEVNGLDEFLTKFQLTVPQYSHKNKADLLSEIMASGYAIEFTRRKDAVNFPSTDWKFDENGFFVCLNRSVDGSDIPTDLDTPEIDENFSSVTGILEPDSAYNLRMSPKRNLIRKMKFLSGSLTKDLTAQLLLEKAEGNDGMASTMNADGCDGDFTGANLVESDDIAWDNSNIRNHDPLWLPELYQFDYPVSYSDYLAISANPRGVVEFNDGSEIKKGFIMDFKFTVQTQMGNFTLLRANI